MDKSVKAIFSAMTPIELVCSMGISVKEHNNNYITQCPCCGNSLFILPTSFVCANNSCQFKAGSVVEFIAVYDKKSIRDALGTYIEITKSKTQYALDEESIDSIYNFIIFQRRLFDFFLRLSHSSSPDHIATVRQTGALQRTGISCETLKSSVYVLTKKDLAALNQLLTSRGLDIYVPTDTNAAIAMPYFKDHHTISDIVMVTRLSRTPTRIKIQPSKLSWFGLLQLHPGCREVDLTVSYADSMIFNTENAKLHPNRICLHYIYNSTSVDKGWLPDKATFLFNEEPDEYLSAMSCLGQVIPNLTVSYKGNQKQDYRSFAVSYCASVLEKEGLSTNAILILESAKLTAADREGIAKNLHDRKQFALARKILSMCKTQMVFFDEHNELYTSPDGYFVQKGKTGNKSYVTNFTIQITDNIVFADSLDVFHRANVCIGGKEYVTVLRPQDIDRAQDLELAVRSKVDSTEKNTTLPTIREKSLVRVVSSYLRDQISRAPQTEGIPFLGWNGHRTRFFGPFFSFQHTESTTRPMNFHPHVDEFGCFSSQTLFDRSFCEALPLPITKIISQAVAIVVRYYLNIPTKPIVIHNNKYGRVLVEALFEAIGQTKPLQINSNIRQKELPGINGYPVYTTADTKHDVKNMPYPVFALCDGGELIDVEYSAATLVNAGQSFRHIIYQVVEWLMKTKAKTFDQMSGVNYADAYAAEGSMVICEVCQIDRWLEATTEFKNLESFLSKVSFDAAKDFITHDITKHVVTLDLSTRDDIDIDLLCQELSALGASYVEKSAGKITSDSLSLLTAIEHYYKRKPEVNEIFDVDSLIAKT
jgi:hypothetical protein